MFVRAFPRADNGAFEGSADKEALRFAVGINCRSRCHIGFSCASHRSRRNAGVRAESDISALGKGRNRAVVVKHDNKIGDLRPNLRSPTGAAGPDKRWP